MTTSEKTLEWNADKFVLHLIGILTKLAFFEDGDDMFGMAEIIQNLYKVCLTKFEIIFKFLDTISSLERWLQRPISLVFLANTSAINCYKSFECFIVGEFFVIKS